MFDNSDNDFGRYPDRESMMRDLKYGSLDGETNYERNKPKLQTIIAYDVENFLMYLDEQGVDLDNVFEILESQFKDKKTFKKDKSRIVEYIGRENKVNEYVLLEYATKKWINDMNEEEKAEYIEEREKVIGWRDNYPFDTDKLLKKFDLAKEEDRKNKEMIEFENYSREINEKEPRTLKEMEQEYKIDHFEDEIVDFEKTMTLMHKIIERIKKKGKGSR